MGAGMKTMEGGGRGQQAAAKSCCLHPRTCKAPSANQGIWGHYSVLGSQKCGLMVKSIEG